MPDDSLLLAIDEIRGKTLHCLSGVGADEATFAPPGLHNHILWHAGHCYVLAEWLALRAAGAPSPMRQEWFSLFSWDSDPAGIPHSDFPPLGGVLAALTEQRARLKRAAAALSDAQLAAPAPGHSGKSVRYYILHALHDEACHCGEIWLLRKMWATRVKTSSQ